MIPILLIILAVLLMTGLPVVTYYRGRYTGYLRAKKKYRFELATIMDLADLRVANYTVVEEDSGEASAEAVVEDFGLISAYAQEALKGIFHEE